MTGGTEPIDDNDQADISSMQLPSRLSPEARNAQQEKSARASSAFHDRGAQKKMLRRDKAIKGSNILQKHCFL